jgi:hypothetical protein
MPQHVLVAAADREPLGVEVLEQGLRELPRSAELVAERRQGDDAAAAAGQGDQLLLGLRKRVRVVVKVLAHPDRPASFSQRLEVICIELRVERWFEAGISQPLF